MAGRRARQAAAVAVNMAMLGALCIAPASAVSMYQPGLGSILKAVRAAPNATHAEANAAPLSVFSTTMTAVAACLPLSVKFYDAQRSGQARRACGWPVLPEAACGTNPDSAHRMAANSWAGRAQVAPADARVSWRADSGLYDEVLGGFYDAGDYVKFVWPQVLPCSAPAAQRAVAA